MIGRMQRRRAVNAVMTALCALGLAVALVPLASVLWLVLSRGVAALDLHFFTALPSPVGESGGGVGNAIAGTFYIVGIAGAIGVPLGVGAGVYLAERGGGRAGDVIRFTAEVLSGVPSIIVGFVAYGPLGVPEWRTSLRVILRTALGGIMTAVLLAVARAAGETAPLLFTSLNNQYWNWRADQPTASLTVQIYNYAVSPYENWHDKAWAAALVLLLLVGVLSLAARLLTRQRFGAQR